MNDPLPLETAGGVPVLFGVLGAIFHLELLASEDEARLEQVSELVWDWFGQQLRWSRLSVLDVEPFSRKHFEYISCYAADLDQMSVGEDQDAQIVANNLAGRARSDFLVAVNGADARTSASPFYYAFWAEIPEAGLELRLPAYAVLQVCVPETWPIDDFYARVRMIASALRIRWGTAGYTFAAWNEPELWVRARYRHARRYPGYDLDEYERLVQLFYQRIRSVNWLTFVGPALMEHLRATDPIQARFSHLSVTTHGDGLLVQAGERPERGDINRLIIPEAYREADAFLRPLRVHDSTGVDILGPWSGQDVARWIQRFERRII